MRGSRGRVLTAGGRRRSQSLRALPPTPSPAASLRRRGAPRGQSLRKGGVAAPARCSQGKPASEGGRHGGAARGPGAAAAARALLRGAAAAPQPPARAVPEDPAQQRAGLRHRGRIRHGEAAAGAEAFGGAQRGRAEPGGRGAGAGGAGGHRGLQLGPGLPLQRLGGGALPPAADADHRLPHPALRGAHWARGAAGGRVPGPDGGPRLPPGPPRGRHPAAGGEPAGRHGGAAPAGSHQLPAGPHGAALGRHRLPPAGGGPGSDFHLPPGNGGLAAGPHLRRLGRLQRAAGGAAPLLLGGAPPPRQKGVKWGGHHTPRTPPEPLGAPQGDGSNGGAPWGGGLMLPWKVGWGKLCTPPNKKICARPP